jgi:CRP/FNR family cyclic AMP-dependent transcriptional regulator
MTGGNVDPRLLNFSLFATLDSDNDLREILTLAEPFSVDAGVELFRQGDAADGMYAIHEGEIAIRVRVPGDTTREISRVGPGDFLGELALLDLGRRSASAIAVRPTSGYFFGEDFFTWLRHTHRPATRKVMDRISLVTCGRIRTLIADIACSAAALACERDRPPVFVNPPDKLSPSLNLDASLDPDFERDGPLAAGLPFFQRFEPGEVFDIMKAWRRIDVARGQLLYSEGSQSDHCILILRGAVRIGVTRNGWSEPCTTLGPGQLVAAVGVVDGQPHPADAASREATTLLAINRDDFVRLCGPSSTAALKLSAALAETLVAELRGVLRNVARLDAQGRLQNSLASASANADLVYTSNSKVRTSP